MPKKSPKKAYRYRNRSLIYTYYHKKTEAMESNIDIVEKIIINIIKKNRNENPDKHSRSIFAESVNEMCQKNGYRK